MSNFKDQKINHPHLIFLGDVKDPIFAKTGMGLTQWQPQKTLGQLKLGGCQVDLGLPDLSIAEAKTKGVKSLVIGVAPIGGQFPDEWLNTLEQALDAGLDLVNGLHTDLSGIDRLRKAAEKTGARIINTRIPPENLPVGTGKKRNGFRLLTVGTDCAVGKKYTALSITQGLIEAGIHADFRATGQTGIMIAGSGISVDSVVSDFLTGAVELISPDNQHNHWDIIEGQGSLFNPSYSTVSMGLIHGSQPDAIVLCHDATRETISTCPEYQVPSLQECIDFNLQCARIVNPNCVCIGVSVNTSGIEAHRRQHHLDEISAQLNLPCVDPLVNGSAVFVDAIKERFKYIGQPPKPHETVIKKMSVN